MSDGSFLSRWSRRKAEVARGVAPPAPDEVAAPAEPASDEPGGDALQALIDALPKLDELTRESDFTAFLAKGVPAALRDAALRKLWSLDPELGKWSDMAEYAWDWNTPGMAPGYGPLEEGFDAQAMLDRILPRHDLPEPPEAGKLALDQGRDEESRMDAAGEAATAGDAPSAAPDEPAGVIAEAGAEGPFHSAENEAMFTPAAPAGAPDGPPSATSADAGSAPGKRRKHGGALPRLA